MHELDTGTAGNLEKVKLKEHIDQFLRIRKNDLSPNTYADYENILVKHVIPIMGELYVNKIKSIQLQEYYALKLETLSACTVNKHHRVLKKLFKTAMQMGIIAANPTELVDPPKVPKSQVGQAMSIEDVRKLLDFVKNTNMELPIMLAALCGLRRGEVCALRWCDIDLKKNTLRVERSLCRVNGEIVIKLPKSDTSIREIQMPSIVNKTIKKHYKTMLENKIKYGDNYSSEDFLISNELGEFMDPDYLSHSFSLTLEKAGLEHIRYHDLRHTNATIMLTQGVPLKVASERLGHSTINITADLYSHVTRDLDKEASERIDGIFDRKFI